MVMVVMLNCDSYGGVGDSDGADGGGHGSDD